MLDTISIPREVQEAHANDPTSVDTSKPQQQQLLPDIVPAAHRKRLTWLLILGVFCACLTIAMGVYTFVFNLGSRGPSGLTGPMGATGPTGTAGAAGPRGPQGLQGPQGPQGPEGDQGTQGNLGPQGLSCWDEDADNQCDPSEDKDGGGCSISDCRGLQGFQGPLGPTGPTGPQGPPGPGGGTNCWALDINNTCTTNFPNCNQSHALVADKNCDGACDAIDCRGFDCHDINMNRHCDPEEDINGDGNCTVLDCIGPRGVNGTQGIQGIQGPTGATGAAGPTGPTGQRGLMCHDKNDDGICQRFCSLPAPNGVPLNASNEDTNCDGICNWEDCYGQQGNTGATGDRGFNGSAGPAGRACWEVIPNGICDPSEDVDGDGDCTLADCQEPLRAGYFGFTDDARNINADVIVDFNNRAICGWTRGSKQVDLQCQARVQIPRAAVSYRFYIPIPRELRFLGNATTDPYNTTSGQAYLQTVGYTSGNEWTYMNPVTQTTGENDTLIVRFGEGLTWVTDIAYPNIILEIQSRVMYRYDWR